jgi:hypothetical protein
MVQHLLRGICKECRIYWAPSIRLVHDVTPQAVWAAGHSPQNTGCRETKYDGDWGPAHAVGVLCGPSRALPEVLRVPGCGRLGTAGRGWGHHGQAVETHVN